MVDGGGQEIGTDTTPGRDVDDQAWGLRFETPPPGEVTAGEAFSIELGVSGPAEREGVEVTVGLREGTFAGGDSEVTTTTDADGVAGFEVAIEEAGTGYVMEARIDAAEGDGRVVSGPVDVLAAGASSEASSIEGDGGVVADGQAEASVTVELRDAYGNPVVSEVPEFEATGDGNSYKACSETDQEGVAECAMTSTSPGEKTLRLTAPVEVEGETIEFVPYCNPDLTPFGGGEGNAESPHLICPPEHLDNVGKTDTYLDDAFRVVGDIDMSQVEGFNIIGGNSEGYYDGPEFAGTFDGGGHVIRNLTIDATDQEGDKLELFGTVGEQGRLEDVILEEVTVKGHWQIGGVVGINRGEVVGVSVTGEVEGETRVGGAVGANAGGGIVRESRAECRIGGRSPTKAGGLVGHISTQSKVVDSSASVEMPEELDSSVGGLIGVARETTLVDVYAAGAVDSQGGSKTGGLIGSHELTGDDVQRAYWDVQTSGISTSSGLDTDDHATGLNTGEFADSANFEGWDSQDTWTIQTAPDGEQRPVLQWRQN
jgi:hypothetical protein